MLDRIQASANDERAENPASSSLLHSREFQAEEFCKVVGLSALIGAKSCSEDVVLSCIYEVGLSEIYIYIYPIIRLLT